jgi:16S rRNA (guanine527-N7)-methyltransferase
VDLGSGGGLPGLPLALLWPASEWILLDGNLRRTAWLADAVSALGLQQRVEVVRARAEDAGRGPLRGGADLVVARSFAGPAATAECAAPLLKQGGVLIVAEPPGGHPDRWPATGLDLLGLEPSGQLAEPVAFQRLTQVRLCEERYPRPNGRPAKRPLFS